MSLDTFRNSIFPLKDKLYRLALSIIGNKQDAEDVVQDVLLSVWNKRADWSRIDNWEAYCVRSTRNAALDKLELSNNQLSSIPEGYDPRGNMADIHTMLEEKDQVALLERLIKELPEKQRTVFQLREIEEMSYKEIAYAMHISEEQVKVNLFRSRQKIKELFDKKNQ